MAKILVTGGCGYIGSHTLIDLIENGYEVISVDNNSRSNSSALKGIELITGNFDDTLPVIINGLDKLDLMFVDGNHQKDATLRYFEWCLPRVHENTLLIFDDIYWSEGMKEAWAQIKAHPQVTVTVDLFWIGLVFFRKGQVKEDFKIRI